MTEAPRYRSFGEQSLHYFGRDHVDLPTGPIDSPAAWRGRDLLARPDEWRIRLHEPEIAELEAALSEIERQDVPLESVTAGPLPLPRLRGRAAEWRRELSRGRGFLVLSALPIDRWSEERSALAFWLLGHLLGQPGAQNAAGELLGHVRDYGERDARHTRLYRTASEIGFHCDAADVVGLLCLETAVRGGASRIASSVAIWNELYVRDRAAAYLLFEPFAVDRRDEQPAGDRPWFEMPPCRYGADEVLRTFYHGEYFRSVERLEQVGPLSRERRAALDAYDSIGNEPDFRLDMQLARGEIQLLSNHTIVHARTDYEDDSERKRHLLRLWLSLPAAPA